MLWFISGIMHLYALLSTQHEKRNYEFSGWQRVSHNDDPGLNPSMHKALGIKLLTMFDSGLYGALFTTTKIHEFSNLSSIWWKMVQTLDPQKGIPHIHLPETGVDSSFRMEPVSLREQTNNLHHSIIDLTLLHYLTSKNYAICIFVPNK